MSGLCVILSGSFGSIYQLSSGLLWAVSCHAEQAMLRAYHIMRLKLLTLFYALLWSFARKCLTRIASFNAAVSFHFRATFNSILLRLLQLLNRRFGRLKQER